MEVSIHCFPVIYLGDPHWFHKVALSHIRKRRDKMSISWLVFLYSCSWECTLFYPMFCGLRLWACFCSLRQFQLISRNSICISKCDAFLAESKWTVNDDDDAYASRPRLCHTPITCVCVSETKFVNEQEKMLEKIRFTRLANALQWECEQNSVVKRFEVLQNLVKNFKMNKKCCQT